MRVSGGCYSDVNKLCAIIVLLFVLVKLRNIE